MGSDDRQPERIGRIAIEQLVQAGFQGRFLLFLLHEFLLEHRNFRFGLDDVLLRALAGGVLILSGSQNFTEQFFLGSNNLIHVLNGVEIVVGFLDLHDDFALQHGEFLLHRGGILTGDFAAQIAFAKPGEWLFHHEAFFPGVGQVAAGGAIHRSVFEHRVGKCFFLGWPLAHGRSFGACGAEGRVVVAGGFNKCVEG